MSFDLEQLNLIVSYDERVAVIQQLIEANQYEQEIQTYLLNQFSSRESTESWIQYCLNIFIWASENNHFKASHLNSDEFLIILKRTSDFSQRRILWDLQRTTLKPGDHNASQFIKHMVSQVQGIERSYLRKILSYLEEGLPTAVEPQWLNELLSLNLEGYGYLSREEKLYYLKEISNTRIPLPRFCQTLLERETDSFVISSMVKIFPQLFVSVLKEKTSLVFDLFRPYTHHQDARVRSNGLEGLISIFENLPLDESFYNFLLGHTRDPDSRVKGVALKGLGIFAGENTQKLWIHALENCSAQEELESLLWTLEGLNLVDSLKETILRANRKLKKQAKTSAGQSSDDQTVISLSDKDQI